MNIWKENQDKVKEKLFEILGSKIESLPSDLEYFKIVYPSKYIEIMLEELMVTNQPLFLVQDTWIYDNYSN